jgi:hypothetical protein
VTARRNLKYLKHATIETIKSAKDVQAGSAIERQKAITFARCAAM